MIIHKKMFKKMAIIPKKTYSNMAIMQYEVQTFIILLHLFCYTRENI